MDHYDVVVVGGGNAALCAALSAAENGASVGVIERAPFENRGGNSAFTGGAFRVAYDGVADIKKLVPDLSTEEIETSDFGTYTEKQFFDEWVAQSLYRADADVIEKVVGESLNTMLWLRENGVRFVPLYGRQSFKVNGKFKFWGGLTVEASGGGLGLMQSLYRAAEQRGVSLHYGLRATTLERAPDETWIVHCRRGASKTAYSADAVILASGGFHANLEWRAKYLGPKWDLAKVRGSRFNTGDGIRMAMEVGAIPHGHWTGCHAVFYDLNAPPFGDINLLDQQKNYFTLGIVVNADGMRFIDEGAEFRNYNYSKMGGIVLAQPNAVAWEVFDQQTIGLLPGEYRVKHATRLQADTLEALAEKMDGINQPAFLETVRAFNAAIHSDVNFNPAVKDGRATTGLQLNKSNWALALVEPPFIAYAVTCGITCTYGGLKVNPHGQVIDVDEQFIPGLYAAGELVGGLYYVNYAGGAGLTAGSVLGRATGRHAAHKQWAQ